MKWVVAMLLLAGCMGSPANETAVNPEDGGEEPTFPARLYLQPDGTLGEVASEELFQMTWNNEDHFLENRPHRWTYQHESFVVHNATAHITYTSETPLAASQYRSGELTTWWGAGDYIGGHSFAFTEPVFSGTVQTVMPLEVPPAGLVIAKDWPLHIEVGSYLVDPLDMLYIDLEQSYLEVDATWTMPFAWDVTPETTLTGALGDCTGGAGQRNEHTFDPGNATNVEIQFTSDGPGHPDLDVFIMAGEERVMRAHGSTGDESFRIYPQNMVPGPWTLSVVALCAGERTYELDIFTGR